MYYSPVRHSVNPASWVFLVRLACIRHAASVYPEPGSNSSFDLCSPDYLLIRISYKLIDVVCVLIFLFSFQRSVLASFSEAACLSYLFSLFCQQLFSSLPTWSMIISWCLNPCWRSFMILPSLLPLCQLVFLEIALRCGRMTISHGQISCLMTSRSCMACAILLVRTSSQQERNINLLNMMLSHFLGKNICNHFAQLLFFSIRNFTRLTGCLIQIWISLPILSIALVTVRLRTNNEIF